MLAQVIAAGTSAGFSGNWKPIQALAATLDVPIGASPSTGSDTTKVEDALSRLASRLGVAHAGRSYRR